MARRRALAKRYDELLKELYEITLPWQHADGQSAWHLYVIQVEAAKRRAVFDQMRAAGIGVNVHYVPVYWQPYYQALNFREDYCPAAERYYGSAISLPIFPAMTESDQDRVVETLRGILARLNGM